MHDPNHLILRRALRVAIILPLTFFFVDSVLGLEYGAPYAAFGTFALLAFADFGGPNRDRMRAYLITGLAGLVGIALGTLAAYNPVASVASTFIVGAGLTYAGVLRGYVATATIAVLLPFVIAVTAGPGDLGQLPERLAGFAVAVTVSTASALLLWPAHMRSALRSRVAESLTASANLISAIWPVAAGTELVGEASRSGSGSPIDVDTRLREMTAAHHRLREQYEGQPMRPGGATSRDRALMQLIDELGRLRLFMKWRSKTTDLGMGSNSKLARTAAETIAGCGEAIGGSGQCPDPEVVSRERESHRRAAEEFASAQLAAGDTTKLREGIDTGFQLRIIALFAELIARNTRLAMGARDAGPAVSTAGISVAVDEPTPGRILRTNLTWSSPWMRNSIRAGLALAIAVTVVLLTQVDHGFWVVLGTIAALRLDAVSTTKTALRAILGTVAGFAVGSLILWLFGQNAAALWVLFPIVVFLSAFTPTAIGIAVGQASFTIFVIVFYSIIVGPTFKTGQDRVVDVAIGLVISLFVSLLMWPRGVAAKVQENLAGSVSASTEYLLAAYRELFGAEPEMEQAQRAKASTSNALSTAYETFDLALSQSRTEPNRIAAWSFIANASGHIATSADLVGWISESGRAPKDSARLRDPLLACATSVRDKTIASTSIIDQSVDALEVMATDESLMPGPGQQLHRRGAKADPSDGTPEGADPFDVLETAVSDSLAALAGRPDERGRREAGVQAISTIWSQDWLWHLNWVADQIAVVAQRSASSPPDARTTATGQPA